MIELPKDATGHEIPLDTSELFISDGTMVHVLRFEYMYHTHDARDTWFVYIERTPGECMTLHACDVHLTPPDSWEKLEEDLGIVEDFGGTSYLDGPACAYARSIGKSCGECKLYGGTSCVGKMCADIASRIHKLRGED